VEELDVVTSEDLLLLKLGTVRGNIAKKIQDKIERNFQFDTRFTISDIFSKQDVQKIFVPLG
jgi:hypothetical protein